MDTINDTPRECGRRPERRQQRTETLFPLVLPGGTCIRRDRRCSGDRRRKPLIPELQLFRNIECEQLSRALAACPVREYADGEVLLAPGQTNHDIYLVLSGQLSVRIGSDGAALPLIIERGECVGEMSIIDGKPVSAVVVAQHGCRVLVVPDAVFWSQIIGLPGIARNLLTILSERMRQDNEIIIANIRDKLHYEHIEKELQTARLIQSSMLPRGRLQFPVHETFDVYTLMDPAREIGGDCFDAFLIGEDQLFFAIGDVSGKGIPAALFMVKTLTLLRMEALRNQQPHEVLTRVNRQLCEHNDHSMFVTVFCGILDIARGEISYCNAGHDEPLIGGSGTNLEFAKSTGGMMLGIAPDARYQSSRIALRAGDLVLCYTDGVTEAMNPRQELFGQDRLRASVSGSTGDDAAQLVCTLHDGIRAFAQGAPQSDDIAILALKYHGKK